MKVVTFLCALSFTAAAASLQAQPVNIGNKIPVNPNSPDGNWSAFGFRPRVVGDTCFVPRFRNVNRKANFDGFNEWSWTAVKIAEGTLCTNGKWKDLGSGNSGGGVSNILIKNNGDVFWVRQ